METKPIKRNKHIIQLSKDHHVTLLFCWKIRTGLKFGIDPARIKRYVQYFWQYHIQPHFIEEETILFASVTRTVAQRAFEEHAQIAGQIKVLDSNGDHEQDKLLALVTLVDNHIRYEERELFTQLEKLLTDEALQGIGRRIIAHHDPTLKDDFDDKFWLKPSRS